MSCRGTGEGKTRRKEIPNTANMQIVVNSELSMSFVVFCIGCGNDPPLIHVEIPLSKFVSKNLPQRRDRTEKCEAPGHTPTLKQRPAGTEAGKYLWQPLEEQGDNANACAMRGS